MQTKITILDHLQFDCPTADQKNVLNAMSTFVSAENQEDFFVLCGSAGTGKTSIINALVGYLKSKAQIFSIAAPTGRAARIISSKTKNLGGTIHSLIYNVESDPRTGIVNYSLKNNEAKNQQIYIIDEASMVSATKQKQEGSLFQSENCLLNDLILYVKSGNATNKIIFLGDKNQLPPINEKKSLALCKEYLSSSFNLKGTSHLLKEVKRQADGTLILKNANEINTKINEGFTNHSLSDFEKKTLYKAAENYISDVKNDGYDSIVSIGCTHNMNHYFNGVVREKMFGLNTKKVVVGDLLIFSKNWQRDNVHIYNGDQVEVIAVNWNSVDIVAGLHFLPVSLKYKDIYGNPHILDDLLLLETINSNENLNLEQEQKLRHERFQKNPIYRESKKECDDRYIGAIRASIGYSITCNKAQGGEWKKVYLNTFKLPSLNFTYTAITRASESLVLY